jgi:hypothetical protein
MFMNDALQSVEAHLPAAVKYAVANQAEMANVPFL